MMDNLLVLSASIEHRHLERAALATYAQSLTHLCELLQVTCESLYIGNFCKLQLLEVHPITSPKGPAVAHGRASLYYLFIHFPKRALHKVWAGEKWEQFVKNN